MTPATLARAVATVCGVLASDIDARAALARTFAPRRAHDALVTTSRAAVVRALCVWDAACLAAVGADPALVLPAWPRWRGLRCDPAALAAGVGGVEDAREVEDLAGECLRWAAECDAWRDGEQKGAA